MKKIISLIVVSILLAACAPQATVTPTATAPLTATSAPTKTPIPTPTSHPDFLALQEAIAASGERFTLDGATGLIYDGADPIPGITVAADGTITLEIDGETIVLDSESVSFDDQEGITVEENERKLQWGVNGWEQAGIAQILDTLDLSETDHESYADANYRIETREWQGQQVQMLIHDEPKVDGERVDAMKVTVNGVEQWVRGAYYPVEGYGGMVVDVIVHPVQERRAYFTTPEGAQAVYGELLTAIAHQKGMSEQGLANYLASHDNKIEIVLPEFNNPDNRSKNRSPSYLKASESVTVDLSKPVVYASRTGSYVNQEVAPGVTVPDGIRWVTGSSNSGTAVFVANEQLFVVFEFDGNVTTDRPGYISDRLFTPFELIAMMRTGFVDAQGTGKSVLEKFPELRGANYSDGDTIIDRDLFYTVLPDGSDYEFTSFELK